MFFRRHRQKVHFLFQSRMDQGQERAPEGNLFPGPPLSVPGIPPDGKTRMTQLNPDLVASARIQPDAHQCAIVSAFKGLKR